MIACHRIRNVRTAQQDKTQENKEPQAMDFTVGGVTVTEAVWVPLVSALAGGALALLGSFCATWQANRAARKTREQELEREGATRAFSTFFKLLDAHNSAANLQREIDEMFATAAENGDADMEPWGKVMELVGAPNVIERIDPSETSFLIGQKKADLLNEVHLIQSRIANIMASAQKYSQVRSEIDAFLLANMSEGEVAEGTQFRASFEGKAKLHAQLLEMRANNLLGQIIANLHEDVPRCWEAVGDFKDAASKRYGDRFPQFKLDVQIKE